MRKEIGSRMRKKGVASCSELVVHPGRAGGDGGVTMFRKQVLVLAVVSVFMLLGVSSASAVTSETFNFTSDHCTGGCLTGQTSGGTVTVTDLGGGVLNFSISLANGNQFVNTGFDASFGFNTTGVTSVTYSAIVPAGTTAPGFFIPPPGTNPQAQGSLHMDGLGFFTFGLEGAGTGGSQPDGSSLTFTVTGAGLTLASLTPNDQGQIFGADIISGTTGLTGGIDASRPTQNVAEPATIALLGTALVGLALLGRRAGTNARPS
jgi:hypothetical protein